MYLVMYDLLLFPVGFRSVLLVSNEDPRKNVHGIICIAEKCRNTSLLVYEYELINLTPI